MFTGNTRDNQQVFNYVYEQFVINRKPKCVGADKSCRYAPQTADQIGCAIGCLLPLETAKEWDICGVFSILNCNPARYAEFFDEGQIAFLTSLQRTHDDIFADIEYTRRCFESVAQTFNLTIPTQTNSVD